MGDAEDLALLGVAPAVRLAPAGGCPVTAFVDSHDFRPGTARAIGISAIYRMYLDWSGATPPVSAGAFVRRIYLLGFKPSRKKRALGRAMAADGKSARLLLRWLELNPQPFGWAKEFRSRIWGKGDK